MPFLIDFSRPPKLASVSGAVFITVSFVLMGPLPFLPMAKSLGLIVGALVLQGIGLGAQVYYTRVGQKFPNTLLIAIQGGPEMTQHDFWVHN